MPTTEVRLTGMPGSDVYQMLITVNQLVADLAAVRTELIAAATAASAHATMLASERYRALGNPGFVIATNFDVKNGTAIPYTNAGTLKTLAANTTFDTGTSATFPAGMWAAATLSVDGTGTGVVTWNTNASGGYLAEALAIATLTAVPDGNTPLGYFTVLAAGSSWVAGTDALAGGTGGTPATTTNYYNSIDPNSTVFGVVTVGSPSYVPVSTTGGSVSAGLMAVDGAGSVFTG